VNGQATSKGEADVELTQAAPPAGSASEPLQSRERSKSFRQSAPVAPSANGDVSEANLNRIKELEQGNQALTSQQEDGAAKLAKAEEEIEGLRNDTSDLAALKAKAADADRLQSELASTQKSLLQAQQAAKGPNRRASAPSTEISEQLASKTSTIESLELELSNLRNQLSTVQASASEHEASTKEIEDRALAAETATSSVQQELDALKISMVFPSDDTKAANENPEALTKRITVLESDLRTANSNLDAAATRATSLEQKIAALTKLHRDAISTSQAKDRDVTELRNQLKRRDRPSHIRDASEFELADDETETGALQARIRALEAENFDLRRNVWRDKRAEMQPSIEDDHPSPGPYEDVDLGASFSGSLSRKGSAPRQTSTLQDVISSGITAFAGLPREFSKVSGYGASPRPRKQSLALLSEDGGDIDPEAFRLAQEEQARQRIERVKEVKRGLEKWKGWRLDLTESRRHGIAGGKECGPVFEL